MKFSTQVFDAYNTGFDSGVFTDFFHGLVAGRSEYPPALSGLADLGFQLSISEEFAASLYPRLDFLERELQSPGIFRDGNGEPAAYSRSLDMPCRVEEEARKFIWKDGKSFFEQPFTLWVCALSLARVDYYPTAGDIFRWRDTWRQVTVVKVDPSDYFGATGFPLFFRIESSLWVPEFGTDGSISCSPVDGGVVVTGVSRPLVYPVTDEADDDTVARVSTEVAPATTNDTSSEFGVATKAEGGGAAVPHLLMSYQDPILLRERV